MRILRIRRGFTTNSSGANEYLPSDGGAMPSSVASVPSALRSAYASASGRAASRDAGVSSSLSTTPSAPRPDREGRPMSNTSAFGLVVLAVLGAFAAGPVLRWVRRRSGKDDHPTASGNDPR